MTRDEWVAGQTCCVPDCDFFGHVFETEHGSIPICFGHQGEIRRRGEDGFAELHGMDWELMACVFGEAFDQHGHVLRSL